MNRQDLLASLPSGLLPWLVGADHLDVKTVSSRREFAQVLAGVLNFRPAWLRALYALRGILARLLGLAHHPPAPLPAKGPAALPWRPGEVAGGFRVLTAEPDSLWVGEAADRHLSARLALWAAPPLDGRRRYHLATIVHYRDWRGPLYFNLIRPFHHLVASRALHTATGHRQNR